MRGGYYSDFFFVGTCHGQNDGECEWTQICQLVIIPVRVGARKATTAQRIAVSETP